MPNQPLLRSRAVSRAELSSAGDRWSGLLTLIRARLLIATLAIPIGVLLRPDATDAAWWTLWWSLLSIGGLSALFWLGVRVRRGVEFQTWVQVATDVAIVTALSALSGGRDSQFVLFFALVVITGGLLLRVAGGLVMAGAACAAFTALPWVSRALGAMHTSSTLAASLPPGMLVAYLLMMGVLSGILGERVQRAREELERTARELDRVRVDNDVILRHLTTGVLTVDGRARVAYLNPAAEQFLGLRALECRAHALDEALPERLRPLRDLISEAVFQDLTDVQEMERRARRNKTLAEVGALAAGIAHELRNGLNPISGSVECLQRELKLEGENAQLMELITTECSRLNGFVTDLLSYSRDRDLVIENVDIEDHLADLCEELSRDPRFGRVTVRVERGGPSGSVQADRVQIRQVWLNLATNALEAMDGHGTLTVGWGEGESGQVVVEFIDDGPGVATEDLSRVGQPFFTTKQGGTGLGLAIAQRIVERHGGMLSLENAASRGAVVRVMLPGVVKSAALAA